jgi:hypothetical protein
MTIAGQAPGAAWAGRLAFTLPAARPISMTKKIKALRKATLYTHKEHGKASFEANVVLTPGDSLDLKEPAKKLTENHTKYEVRLPEGLVYLVEGVDFEFI